MPLCLLVRPETTTFVNRLQVTSAYALILCSAFWTVSPGIRGPEVAEILEPNRLREWFVRCKPSKFGVITLQGLENLLTELGVQQVRAVANYQKQVTW